MISIALFWVIIGFLIYSYVGYTLILLTIFFFKRTSSKSINVNESDKPEITLIIAAYNEERWIKDKVENSNNLSYPKEKITFIWINDASSDSTSALLSQYPNITVLTQPERKGKMAALNLAMKHVKTPYAVFTDANAMLAPDSIEKLIELFTDERVGCVAGEKRIISKKSPNAAAIGESTYWQYESFIKQLESNNYTTLSATGELYAIRTFLFEEIDNDTILDDFAISSKVLSKGYLIKYVHDAYAYENASANMEEEMKRKARIAAGSFQALKFIKDLINPLKKPYLFFLFFSHKLLRWFLLPIATFALPIINIFICFTTSYSFYRYTMLAQLVFTFLIILGWRLKNSKLKIRWVYIPYYLFIMNISIAKGFIRHMMGKQNVKWEKSKRET